MLITFPGGPEHSAKSDRRSALTDLESAVVNIQTKTSNEWQARHLVLFLDGGLPFLHIPTSRRFQHFLHRSQIARLSSGHRRPLGEKPTTRSGITEVHFLTESLIERLPTISDLMNRVNAIVKAPSFSLCLQVRTVGYLAYSHHLKFS
jgi:hypothetical protein